MTRVGDWPVVSKRDDFSDQRDLEREREAVARAEQARAITRRPPAGD